MSNANNRSGFTFNSRAFTYGLTIGLGIGLAMKNLGLGIGVGVVFAALFGAFRHPAKRDADGCDRPETK